MTIARRQRQQPTCISFVTKSISRKGKKSSLLLCCFLILIGYYSLRPIFTSSNDTLLGHQRAQKKGEYLFFSPKDLPEDLIQSLDAVLVLGGGKPKSIDHPPVFVERRCDDAIEVVRRRSGPSKRLQSLKGSQIESDLPILCLSAGTAHLPQLLSADGLPIWESTACASYILSKNNNATRVILPESIYVETSSYDTIGNAYFARTSHTEFNGWRKLLIITNEFHMSRTVKIFDWIFSAPAGDSSKSNRLNPYDLYYLESPNVGMASEVVAARKEREASSSKSVDYLSKKYTTLAEVYKFLTLKHSLYTAHTLVDRGRATTKDVEQGAVKEAVKRSYGLN